MNPGELRKVRLDFGNLPLVEVAARVSLESPVELTFEIINKVAEQLSSQFPLLTEPNRFEAPPGVTGEVPFGPGRISGAVFTGNPDGLIVTLQSQLVVSRWLKRVGVSASEYPRFPALRDALWQTVGSFKEASEGRLSRIFVVNMSYVNLLRISHAAPAITRYFSDLAQVKATEQAEQIHKMEVSWGEQASVDLRYNLEKVTAKVGDENVEG
ncbi:MAG: hypothetical protein ACYSUQ_01905, partial [Planctomycetota bacterium]